MKHPWLFIFILVLASSCRYFETEKVSSEKIYNEEIKTINWKDVDRYPSFSNCEKSIEKREQKTCFINTISAHLYQSISDKKMVAIRDVHDTVRIDFSVSKKGVLSIDKIKMDTVLQREFPNLETLILTSIDSLQPVAPAYKRGIPVKTQFTLPVIIKTN
jgi:hypothetical protein